ncbi:MAG TPA: Rpp14/Pop5 family protein [Candidatus Omnitrophota bacterium]|nr:Rpp14/Pop5 family protein [Candidatus Omnitrophota bacterium]
MKTLKPSMREKKRYLYVKGNPNEIEKAILNFIGVLGMSKASPAFIKKEKDYAIISINRQSLNEVRASLAVSPEKLEVLRVSGTMKSLREKI